MKRIYSFLTGLPFMAFLFLGIAISMAIATFMESRYGTPAARSLVYNTKWFELLWALFALNLVNNIFKYKLLSRKRFTLGLFHLSFLLILSGAVITRYFSFEGMMHIREGESSWHIQSSDDYFYASLGEQVKSDIVHFSEITPRQYSASFINNGQKIRVKSVGFISDAEKKAIPSDSGEPVIDFVFSTVHTGGMQTANLLKGDFVSVPGFSVGFESGEHLLIRFFNEGDQLFLLSDSIVTETSMTGQDGREYLPGDTIPVQKMNLYGTADCQFLVRNFVEKASFTAVRSQRGETGTDAVIVSVSDGIREQKIAVFGHSGAIPDTVTLSVGSHALRLAYGGVPLKIPFQIRLNDFQLEKYPGSESPSSYASEVTLVDKQKGLERDVRIFMNNTLSYKGYKFFQSSYDRDEQGSILSVNHDFWGTWITYAGYFMLVIGIILSLVNSNSYFRHLVNRLKSISVAAAIGLTVLIGSEKQAFSQGGIAAGIPEIGNDIVKEFSLLWVQGHDGRIEPVSTLSGELIRKVSRKSTLYGKTPDEVLLSMMAWPEIWRTMPIVKVANKILASDLGISGSYVSLDKLIDANGNYLISEKVRDAYDKAPAFRNRVEKEYIYLDERVNICYMIFEGSFLNFYPRNKEELKWYTPGSVGQEYSNGDSLFIKSGFNLLLQSVMDNKPVEGLQVIQAIARFQQKYGGDLIPSLTKRDVEIFYNKVNPFKRVFPFYLLFGFILLFILFMNVLRQKQIHSIIRKIFFGLIFIGFLVHTIGLVLRWYISGHAPWSNGYESIVYVAWAAMFAGLIFGRKYPMVVGTSAFLSGIALFVAHLSWMNPEVTNLVPVLKSYWLTIHVAVITASYGFIGLSAFLGILVLVLIAVRNRENSRRTGTIINQLTTINEMSAMIGLYSLTIGTFLGAVWANESWGRYWGWDPKETWSLITVVIYSFIVHMRLIPSLKGIYNYNLATVLGFASVLMTYFGVNYYLTGLHSYGSGIASGIHWSIPVSFILLVALFIISWMNHAKFEKES